VEDGEIVGVGVPDGDGVSEDVGDGPVVPEPIRCAIGPSAVAARGTVNGFSGVPGFAPPNRITADTVATAARLAAPPA
jgi:hypothetical protein